MPQTSQSDTFEATAGRLDDEQWKVLGLVAAERQMTPSALLRTGIRESTSAWIREAVVAGLLRDGKVVYGLPYTRKFEGERALSMAPTLRTRVLDRFASEGKLEDLCREAKALFNEHSVSEFATSLYSGNWPKLVSRSADLARRTIQSEHLVWQRRRLYESVVCPFEPERLFDRWGDAAFRIIEQVFADALTTCEPTTELYQFCLASLGRVKSSRLLRLMADAAWLRGDADALRALVALLVPDEQMPYRVAALLLAGDLEAARKELDALPKTRGAKRQAANWSVGSVSVLAVLSLAFEPLTGAARAKQFLQRLTTPVRSTIEGWPVVPENVVVARALRSLVRRMCEPDTERLRPSPHPLATDAPIWEVLLLALIAQLEGPEEVGARAWANRLNQDAKRWELSGYTWLAAQAALLAGDLEQAVSREPPSQGLRPAPRFALSGLLVREPEWRRTLRALEQFAETVESREATVSRRVAWFVDMSSGELAKPALEEYRVGAGFTRGRRIDFEELRALRDELPPEDVAVLHAIELAPKVARVPLEAVEALCGHPRVYDGARGKARVTVRRGQCRFVTREERGEFVVEFEPAGVGAGVTVIVDSETQLSVYRLEASLAKLRDLVPVGLRIPVHQKREGLSVLARLADRIAVDSTELGAYRTTKADASPCLRISPEAGAFFVEVGVRPFGQFGRFFPPGLGRSQISVHSGEELFDTERHLDEELEKFQSLVNHCPTLGAALAREQEDAQAGVPQPFSASVGEEELFALLAELRNVTLSFALEWKNGRGISCRGKVTVKSLQGSLKRVKGWYLVDGKVSLEDVTPLSLGQLARMPFTKSGRFVRLPNGDFLELERKVSQVLSTLATVGQLSVRGGSTELHVPEAAICVLKALVDEGSEIVAEPAVEQWLARVESTLSAEPPVPKELHAVLRPYQLLGYQWLWRYSKLQIGVCLADDMGLGKTVQVITLLLESHREGPTLVIAPTSVCTNWVLELDRFAPSLRAVEYTGKSRTTLLEGLTAEGHEGTLDVYVASYAALQQDAAELARVKWNTVVLDEAQFIKNPNSLRAKAAFALQARHRIALTGTPVENHLGDLWSIFHFLSPSLLGSFKHFQLAYLKPIERDRDNEQQALLKKLVMPFIMRRRKSEVLTDLPQITTLYHEVRLSEDEHLRYGLLRRQVHEKLRTSWGKREHKLQVLAEITRLRRFCCHPRLVFPDAPLESAKLQVFLELAEELRENGHRALVFSQFVDFLEIVRQALDERGFRYQYLDGSTPKRHRQTRVSEFQSGDMELFLISLKAGGFGLNLTGADYVIHLDPWWNPAVEAQATDRAHRIGQSRPVTVYRLVTKASIEERIFELHKEKRAIADALLEDAGESSALSESQLMELLALA